MDSYGRIHPNKLGQPSKITFAVQAMRQAGFEVGSRVQLEILPDHIKISKAQEGGFHISTRTSNFSPCICCQKFLATLPNVSDIDRAPKHATAQENEIRLYFNQSITEAQYRFRRWESYQRHDETMSAENTEHLLPTSDNTPVNIRLSNDLFAELKAEAAQVEMNIGTYISELLKLPRPKVQKKIAARAKNYTEIGHIRRQAKGKIWGISELKERGLPLCWNREWLQERVNEGYSTAEMAAEYGYSRTLYQKQARAFGINLPSTRNLPYNKRRKFSNRLT